MFNQEMIPILTKGVMDTLYMTLISAFLSYLLGLPLGLLLVASEKNGIFPVPALNKALGVIINLVRSVPFLILLILLMPFTKIVVGTILGVKATIVALVVAATPFVARLVESSIKEVDNGVIEAAQSMGASPFEIVSKVLLPEAKPSLLIGSAIAVTTILGYSAMAGIVGGGGLGAIAINYGYYRYQTDIMFITVILLVIIVQVLQEVGMKIAKVSDKRD